MRKKGGARASEEDEGRGETKDRQEADAILSPLRSQEDDNEEKEEVADAV